MNCMWCRNGCSRCTKRSRRGKGGTAREFTFSERPPVTDSYGFRRGKAVPFLRMSGNWLRDLGFRIGTRVTVEAKKGQLVITTVKKVEQAVHFGPNARRRAKPSRRRARRR